MEIIIAIIAALVGGLFFYKNKADKVSVDGKLAETKGQDRGLQNEAEEIKKAIEMLDKGIEAARKEREAEKQKKKSMTLAERRESIKKGRKK